MIAATEDMIVAAIEALRATVLDDEVAAARAVTVAVLAIVERDQMTNATCVCLGASWPHVPSSGRCTPAASPFSEVLEAVTRAMATNVRDWGTDRMDAFLWGVLLGWDCDDQHQHDEHCAGAMEEIATRHRWDDRQVERVRRFHRAVLAAAGQAPLTTGSSPSGGTP